MGNNPVVSQMRIGGVLHDIKDADARKKNEELAKQVEGMEKEMEGLDVRSITSIEKTATKGLVDTYTITFSDGTRQNYTVTNGEASEAKIKQFINEWLEENPDATTTVQDGSITKEKLAEDVREFIEEASKTGNVLKMAVAHPIGKLFETEYTYNSWVHNNVQYDASIDRIVILFTSGNAHVSTDKVIQMAVINPRTFETEKVKVIYDSSVHGITGGVYGFSILEDGTYMTAICYDTSSEYSKKVTLYKSVDKGENWTTFEPTINNLPSKTAYNPFSLTVLSNGRLLMNERESRTILYSDNNGNTWETVQLSDYCLEPHFIELSEGKIICIGRKTMYGTSNGAWNGTKQIESAVYWISSDYGTTWEYKGDSTTITEMTSSNCCSVVKDGYIDLFVCSRFPHGDKLGVIYHFYASEEDAFSDNWGTPKVVLYPHCTNPQDFSYIGCCTDSLDNIHIFYYDAIVEGESDIYYMIASKNPVSIPVNADLTNVLALPYSMEMVNQLLSNMYSNLNAKINKIIIQGGGEVEDGELDGSMFVNDGLYEWWDFLDENSYNTDDNTYIGTKNQTTMLRHNTSDASDFVNGLLYGRMETDLSEHIKPSIGYTVEFLDYSTQSVKDSSVSLIRLDTNGQWSNGNINILALGRTAISYNTNSSTTGSANVAGAKSQWLVNAGFNHFVFVVTNEYIRGYVNGVLNQEIVLSEQTEDYSSLKDSFLGMHIINATAVNVFAQTCRLYSKALSEEEVKNNYKYEKNRLGF